MIHASEAKMLTSNYHNSLSNFKFVSRMQKKIDKKIKKAAANGYRQMRYYPMFETKRNGEALAIVCSNLQERGFETWGSSNDSIRVAW